MKTKTCPRCKVEKPLSEFHKGKSRATGKRIASSYCKPCTAERQIEYRKENPELQRTIYRRSAWKKMLRDRGITEDQYNAMLARQKGRCAMCGGGPNGKASYLVVDHDKTTGRNRGLLCSSCNLGIGCLKHDAKIMRSGIKYLAKTA